MTAQPNIAIRTGIGQVQVYLGATSLDEIKRYRELFGGVTLQGVGGLKLAKDLQQAGDLEGVDLDPAVYTAPRAGSQLQLDLDVAPFDWVAAQLDLGLPVIRTAGHRIRVGDIDQVRVQLARTYATQVSVELVLDGGWLSREHIDALEAELIAADRDVTLIFAAVFNPLDTLGKIRSLRRLLQWARSSGHRLEMLRTDMAGVAAATDGACLAAIGLGTSTRHFGLPLISKRRDDYERRQQSPLVFVPRLLHWQRANVLGALTPWRGAGVTDCDCGACDAAGDDLLRFDTRRSRVSSEVGAAVRAHDALALADVARTLATSNDSVAELKRLCAAALKLTRMVSATFKVQLDPAPSWLVDWAS
jgi:hypothetical protein